MSPLQPDRFKLARRPQRNARRREQRIVIAPMHLLSQKRHQLNHNSVNLVPDRGKVGGESFAELCLDLTRILIDAACDEIDMPQFLPGLLISLFGNASLARNRKFKVKLA